MLKTECSVDEQYRNAVQLTNLPQNDTVAMLEQWGIQRTDERYVSMFLCLQRDCGKCLAFYFAYATPKTNSTLIKFLENMATMTHK